MKKQYFIFLAITCMVMFNVNAQNTPIDDFLKKYPSREGVTNVSMSQEMLQAIFAPPKNVTEKFFLSGNYPNVPEAYNSVTISKKDIPENLFTDFKKTLLSAKYEQFMEVNRENSSILGYYLKKVNDTTNEIVVLRHQKDQFSAIYIKGNIDINYVNHHLTMIRSALNRLGADNQTNMFFSDRQFAFTIPSFDNLKFPDIWEYNFKFNHDSIRFKIDDDLKLRLEKSMQGVKDMMQKLEHNEGRRMMQDTIEGAHKQMEEAL